MGKIFDQPFPQFVSPLTRRPPPHMLANLLGLGPTVTLLCRLTTMKLLEILPTAALEAKTGRFFCQQVFPNFSEAPLSRRAILPTGKLASRPIGSLVVCKLKNTEVLIGFSCNCPGDLTCLFSPI